MFGFNMDEACLLAPQPITGAAFAALHKDGRAHRVCFGTTHSNALKPYKGKYPYTLSLPFKETIGPILLEGPGIGLFDGKFGPWHGFETTIDADGAAKWISEHKSEVYIRDLMDLSAATAMNFVDAEYTTIGEATKRAKYEQNETAARACTKALAEFIDRNPPYGIATAICAVPPSPGKPFDLPTHLSRKLAERLDKPLISSGKWKAAKPQLKGVSEDSKWAALEVADLRFDKNEVSGQRVLLIDDLYQSGATSNYVAGRLKAAGATRVFGLSLVKSLRDSDNK